MDESTRRELLDKTQQALDSDDWPAVEQLWQPWIEQGDPEAQYQLAYHYLWCTPCDDDATRDRMYVMLAEAAAKNHPNAIWLLATRRPNPEADPEYERALLRAGQLGSVNAYRSLGVAYAIGDWTGPRNLSEAARWYRLAAEHGQADSQYDLGFMLLLGEGGPKNTEEGVRWLERAGDQGEYSAFRLLADCYENGFCDVPTDPSKAAHWHGRMEEWDRIHPRLRYRLEAALSDPFALDCLLDIEGVTSYSDDPSSNDFSVSYDPTLTDPASLDEQIRNVLPNALPES
jgi:TPR repeat protein